MTQHTPVGNAHRDELKLAHIAWQGGLSLGWIPAASCAVLLHAAAATLVLHHREATTRPVDMPVMALELAPLPRTASVPNAVPQEQEAPPQVQEAQKAPPPTPAEVPVPRGPTEDVAAEEKKPEIEQPQRNEAPQRPPDSPAQSSLPVPVAKVVQQAPAPTAKLRGMSSEALDTAMANWGAEVKSRLEQAKRYPAQARAFNLQDVVVLRITIDRSGRLVGAKVVKSKGYMELDQEAVDLVNRVGHVPPPPSVAQGEVLVRTVSIRFFI
jgi:periplasmic protein TonB